MIKCEVCENTDFEVFPAKEKMYGLNDSFQYRECMSCESLFLNDIPKDLSKYYPTDYYAFRGYRKSSSFLKLLKKLRFLAFKNGLSISPPDYFEWLSRSNVDTNSKIADIGCGNGQLLAELSYCGFNSLHGYDPFIDSKDISEGFSLKKLDFFEIKEKYDLIMFHHSFEHIPSPIKVFSKLIEISNSGTEVIIRVPVTDGKVWKDERENWFQLDAPRHLFIPSVSSMKILAQKFDFELFNVSFDSLGSQFWGTELYKRGKDFISSDIQKEFSKAELINFEKLAIDYNVKNIGDQACFYLRKN
jgi:SAM-dependent methyltransferase